MLVTIDVIPTTIPAIAGVRNFIWEFISDIISPIKSLSLSFTLWISFMYLEMLVNAWAAIFGPFFIDCTRTFIELSMRLEGNITKAPCKGSKIASLTLMPSLLMLVLTSMKKDPETVPCITSATFSKDISAGNPSPNLLPIWNNAEANSSSS